MVCKPGKVCKNCAECFGCHAMKSATVVGNCRPKHCRICPKEKAVRRAEEQMQDSSGGQSSLQNIALPQSLPYLSKTICGNTTSYVIKGDYSMSINQFGQHIRFAQYPELLFSSMESAFEYFEAHAKLEKQRAAQRATVQLAKHTPWQARFNALLGPANVKPKVNTPKRPDTVHAPSRSLSPEIPPQTLFAQSTPHAQDIKTQRQFRPSAKVLPSLAFRSRATNGSHLQQPLPAPQPSNQASTLPKDRPAPRIYYETFSPSSLSTDDEVLAQPQSSFGSHLQRFSSYSATALPQTLANKDKRVLGVALTADVDEIRAAFWLRALQYNIDRCQATSLEERAIASLKLTRAQEAVDRLCWGSDFEPRLR